MNKLNPITHVILAAVLLLASICLYMAYVSPQAFSNRILEDKLDLATQAHGLLVEDKALPYPSPKNRETLNRVEELLLSRLQDLDSVGTETPVASQSLDSIFMEWGYGPDEPVRAAIGLFQSMVTRYLGPEREDATLALTRALALRMCRAGLEEFDHLTFTPTALTGREGADRFDIYLLELGLTSGLAEAAQFLQEWILYPQQGCLVHPLSLSIERVEPGLWDPETVKYSSPPITLALQARITLMRDKGKN